MEKKFLEDWDITDPSNLQFCKIIDNETFRYKEMTDYEALRVIDIDNLTEEDWDNPLLWDDVTININELSNSDMEEAISSYYNNLDEVKEIYGDSWEQIVIECYFEQEITGKY